MGIFLCSVTHYVSGYCAITPVTGPCSSALPLIWLLWISVPDAFMGIYQLHDGSSKGKCFPFRLYPPTSACYMLVCIIVLAFCFWFPCGCLIHQRGHDCNPSEYPLGRHMCLQVMVCDPNQVSIAWLLLSLLHVEGSFMLLIWLCPSHSINMMVHQLGRESKNLSYFPTWWGVVSFSRLCSTQWHRIFCGN